MNSIIVPTAEQQLALNFLQTSNSIATAEQLAAVRMNPEIPRYGQLKQAVRVNWMKDQIFVLNYLRHVKDPNPFDILIDAESTDSAIMESEELRILTQAEIQDAFSHGINGEYGDFFGITTPSLIGFLKAYQSSGKWQAAKAIIYSKEKEKQEEEQRRFDRVMYEKQLEGFVMPFWKSSREKKKVTEEESRKHRELIAKQREEILKQEKENHDKQ